jgi:hypothetical protein
VALRNSDSAIVLNNLFYNHSYNDPYLNDLEATGNTKYSVNYNGDYVDRERSPVLPSKGGVNDVYYSKNDYIDPGFVNPTGLDFHLTSTSPFVDKGIIKADLPSDVTNPHDFDCNKRPHGTQYDFRAGERLVQLPIQVAGRVYSPT